MSRSIRAFFHANKEEIASVMQVLERVDLQDRIHERSDHLSGGQQQRVAIARSLYQEACLFLADEPVASLDPWLAREVLHLLFDAVEEGRCTLIANLHQPDLAKEFFQRIIGLSAGKIVFDKLAVDTSYEDFEMLFKMQNRIDAAPTAIPSARPKDGFRPLDV